MSIHIKYRTWCLREKMHLHCTEESKVEIRVGKAAENRMGNFRKEEAPQGQKCVKFNSNNFLIFKSCIDKVRL